jgi:hypothetical protein
MLSTGDAATGPQTKRPPAPKRTARRSPKKPITDFITLSFPGSEISPEEWEFIQAIARYQARYRVRYPSWREVLYVLRTLGYRKDPKS